MKYGSETRTGGASGWLYFIAALAVVLAVLDFVWLSVKSTESSDQVAAVAEMRVASQRIASSALDAVGGSAIAFANLDQARQKFRQTWGELQTVNAGGNAALIKAIESTWKQLDSSSNQLLNGEDAVRNMHEQAASLSKIVPRIQASYGEVTDTLVHQKAPVGQAAKSQQQILLAERIARAVDDILAGGEQAVVASDQFAHNASQFGRVLRAQLQGDAAIGVSRVTNAAVLQQLQEIKGLYNEFILAATDEVLNGAPQIYIVRRAADRITQLTDTLLNQTTELNTELDNNTTMGYLPSVALGVALTGLALLLAFFIMFRRLRNERLRQQQLELENRKNQGAILRLLDELGDLADGDLTVEATVSEDFTGAIADSINFSIDQLRSLVVTINKSAVQVSSAAQETQSTAMRLSDASDHQAQEITGASTAISEMVDSIDKVSGNASESASVAERSVYIAKNGAEVVRATIRGMDTIREQIQETSKRIKRLGESSQEIGDIVGLINDIADQTNVLALNAAIQASMAGEAGRGFAVVADEVQRLAERSASATKQIETLVKAIQSDTNGAVISMEQTTSEVVKGANLAQDAGVALEEIETVSTGLSDLIQKISSAAQQQASSAGHISNTMNVIQEITQQTSQGTTTTAKSIGNLAEMAEGMRNSVAGFRLPE